VESTDGTHKAGVDVGEYDEIAKKSRRIMRSDAACPAYMYRYRGR
jgi:hypothetical protein